MIKGFYMVLGYTKAGWHAEGNFNAAPDCALGGLPGLCVGKQGGRRGGDNPLY